jgi:hypothetical protein
MSAFKPVRWTFDDGPEFDGFANGTTWNGFDNIWVTPEMHDRVMDWLSVDGNSDEETLSMFAEMIPGPDGLISYAYGFATQVAA